MTKANTLEAYYRALPEERREAMLKLRQSLADNLPEGFSEAMSYGMPGFVVPHSIYPNGYHVKPEEPLPFISLASQKNFIGFYHMGIYSDPDLHQWFVAEYPKHVKSKLDMGKSCVRLKKIEQIPYKLIGELAQKMSVEEWIDIYENNLKR